MILLSLDFETTGLDTLNDRVIEYGAVLYSTTQRKCLDNQGTLVICDKPISPTITKITGIHPVAVEKFGYEQLGSIETIINMMESCEAVIGYNVRRFDSPVLYNWADRLGVTIPTRTWIDLFYDMPWTVPTGKLSHVAADHGILNLFPHSAMSDAQTVLAIASKYDDKLLLSRAQSPAVVLRSHQGRNENDLVKQLKFRWNPTARFWWKPAKEQDVDEIVSAAPFKITIEKGYTPEDLDN